MKSACAAILAVATLFLTTAAAQQGPTPQASTGPTNAVPPITALKVLPRPNLSFFMGIYIRTSPNSTHSSPWVHQNQGYWVCYKVMNRSTTSAGPFQVRGSALGVSSSPYRNHAGFTYSAWAPMIQDGCLHYLATPSPGTYVLQLKVDALNAVTESSEGDNAAQVVVRVIP